MDKQTELDHYWLSMTEKVAERSKDPSTKCGAIILRPDGSVAATGWNGFPRKMPDLPEYYENRDEKYSRVIHCEMNALITMKESAHDCTLYTWPFLTCERCAVHMIQAGITRVVAPTAPPDKMARWADSFNKATKYYNECGVQWVLL